MRLLALLALASFLIGEYPHLVLEHHHWSPVAGGPVHHEHPDTPCGDEEGSFHQKAEAQAAARQVPVEAAPPASPELSPSPASLPIPVVLRAGHAPDPPRTRLRPSRAPPLR